MQIFEANKAWLAAGGIGAVAVKVADIIGDAFYQWMPGIGAMLQGEPLGWDEPSFEGKLVWAFTALAVYLVPNMVKKS